MVRAGALLSHNTEYLPFSIFRTPTGIDDLPDELLLGIGAHIAGLDRNRDLANLALVSRKWRAIAQEWLLKEPRFNITYIDQYRWELSHRSELLGQVKSLEIWSTSEGRIQYQEDGRPERKYTKIPAPTAWDRHFKTRCKAIITKFARDERNRWLWKRALKEDVIPALFGVLLCMLPNLRYLKLGDGWLMDFPIFSTMLCHEVATSLHAPYEWQHKYLAGALAHLSPRLQLLEAPAEMATLFFFHAATVFDFRPFQQLKEVDITMEALWHSAGLRRHHQLPDPRKVFPPTLEVLRISEALPYTPIFLKDLCTAKKGGHFPSLRRVEVYHMENMKRTEILGKSYLGPSPVKDVQDMFCAAELEVYLYFPGWSELRTWEIGATPWRLKEEGTLGKGEIQTMRKLLEAQGPRFCEGYLDVVAQAFPGSEAEWDADGDAVMI
jgi:hypothetical protein